MGAKSGAQRHVHKYFRTSSQVWACGLPDCTHLLPRNMEDMIRNRISICWMCKERMTMGPNQLKMTEPWCDTCILKEKGIKDAEGLLGYLEAGIKKAAIKSAESIDPNDKIEDTYDMDKDGELI